MNAVALLTAQSRSEGRRALVELGLLVSLTVVALGLRLYQIDAKSIWFDEATSFFNALHPDGPIEAARQDIHPPLYYLLLQGWVLFGRGDTHLRLLSALAGAATVPMLYLLGRRLAGSGAGWIAASLLAVSPFHVALSQEVRGYTLLAALTVGSLLALDSGLRSRRALPWIAYVLALALALWLHYLALFLLAAVGLGAVAATWRRPRRLGLAVLATVSAAALFVPWVVIFWRQFRTVRQGFWIPPVQAETVLTTLRYFTLYSSPDHGEWRDPLTIVSCAIFLVAATVGAVALVRAGGSGLAVVSVAVVPFVLVLAVSLLLMPLYIQRYLSFSIPSFLLLAAVGLARFRPRWLGSGALAILSLGLAVGLFGWFADPFYDRADFRSAAREIVHDYRPGDLVMYTGLGEEVPTSYYTGAGYESVVLDPVKREEAWEVGRYYPRIWLVRIEDTTRWGDTIEPIAADLMADFVLVEKRTLSGVSVYLYRTPAAASSNSSGSG